MKIVLDSTYLHIFYDKTPYNSTIYIANLTYVWYVYYTLNIYVLRGIIYAKDRTGC